MSVVVTEPTTSAEPSDASPNGASPSSATKEKSKRKRSSQDVGGDAGGLCLGEDLDGEATHGSRIGALTAERFEQEAPEALGSPVLTKSTVAASAAKATGAGATALDNDAVAKATGAGATALDNDAVATATGAGTSALDGAGAWSAEEPAAGAPEPTLVHAAACSAGGRPYMEDRHLWVQDLGGKGIPFGCVLDGHGGSRCADFALRELHARLAADESLRADGSDAESVARSFERCFEQTDADFLKLAHLESLGDGTTVLCALLQQATLHIANLGDTRAVLGRQVAGGAGECEAIRLSIDHKPNVPEEQQRVTARGGSVRCVQGCWRAMGPPGVKTMLAISRALGNKALKPIVSNQPSCSSTKLSPLDQFVILASDGLWDVVRCAPRPAYASARPTPIHPRATPPHIHLWQVDDKQAVQLARETAQLVPATVAADSGSSARAKAVADSLLQRALQLGSADNITVLVIWLNWP